MSTICCPLPVRCCPVCPPSFVYEYIRSPPCMYSIPSTVPASHCVHPSTVNAITVCPSVHCVCHYCASLPTVFVVTVLNLFTVSAVSVPIYPPCLSCPFLLTAVSSSNTEALLFQLVLVYTLYIQCPKSFHRCFPISCS